ncbi:MAG: metal ABC transporter permease [Patescibacteria group bacterium]|nr:metal ABC transporter permease [Patescibacteria group bacterium]
MWELFQYGFIQRAFLAGIITAVIAPIIGIFLVVRRYSLMADTLAHISLVGVAAGLLTNTNPVIASLIVSIGSSFLIERLRESKKVFGESVLALFLSGGLALAVVLVSLSHGFSVDLISYLFGSISTVSVFDLYVIALLALIICFTTIFLFRQFFIVSFNEELASAGGLKVHFLNNILIVLAAATVVLSLRIVGALLIGALMIIPVISAIQFKKGFLKTLFISIFISLLSVILGLLSSYYLNLPSGATIVVVSLIIFGFSLILN